MRVSSIAIVCAFVAVCAALVFTTAVRADDEHHFGIYRATVVSNADPQHRGRLQLRIWDVFGNATSGWALPCVRYPDRAPVPPNGTWVWVQFEGGNTDYPVWMGWPGGSL